eukprot:XP_014777731.1 PREDICTED: glycerophosphodiester phosphodiesterase domain-containing protein 5-like [Octopus bimaculoides]
MIIINLLTCIGYTIALNAFWPSSWVMLKLSFQIFGPFIHIGLIVIFTILTWILIRQWYIIDQFRLKLLIAVAYMAILVGLYVIPLFIESPCVRPADSLPSKPRLFAHRGASGVAPENTLVAFQLAANQSVYGFESDVRISLDGIPFILHDDTLRRTTNIKEVYPDRVDDDASTFTFAELQKLNAGRWFLEIWWFPKIYHSVNTTNFTQTGTIYQPVEELIKLRISNFNARYDTLSEDQIL